MTDWNIFQRSTTTFAISKIYRLKRKNIGRYTHLNFEEFRATLTREKLSSRRGVYVFGLSRARGKKTPWYIGKTTKTFGDRFKAENHKANTVAAYHGSPFVFFLFPRRGRGDKLAIRDLETHLIQAGYWLNPRLLNDQKKPKYRYKVEGIFPQRKGYAKAQVARDFRSIFGWYW